MIKAAPEERLNRFLHLDSLAESGPRQERRAAPGRNVPLPDRSANHAAAHGDSALAPLGVADIGPDPDAQDRRPESPVPAGQARAHGPAA